MTIWDVSYEVVEVVDGDPGLLCKEHQTEAEAREDATRIFGANRDAYAIVKVTREIVAETHYPEGGTTGVGLPGYLR